MRLNQQRAYWLTDKHNVIYSTSIKDLLPVLVLEAPVKCSEPLFSMFIAPCDLPLASCLDGKLWKACSMTMNLPFNSVAGQYNLKKKHYSWLYKGAIKWTFDKTQSQDYIIKTILSITVTSTTQRNDDNELETGVMFENVIGNQISWT